MNTQSILLLILVLGLAVWALSVYRRSGRRGGCHGACSGCSGCPSGHPHCPTPRRKSHQAEHSPHPQERDSQSITSPSSPQIHGTETL